MSDFNVFAVSLKAQKKLASSLSGRRSVRLVLDDRANGLLDGVFRVLLLASASRRDAERVTKSLIKVVVKVGLLTRNEQFDAAERLLIRRLFAKFRQLVMTVASFCSVDFSYDRAFLTCQLESCQSLLGGLLAAHVTDKSSGRVTEVFNHLKQPTVLDAIFQSPPGSPLHSAVALLRRDLERLVEDGLL